APGAPRPGRVARLLRAGRTAGGERRGLPGGGHRARADGKGPVSEQRPPEVRVDQLTGLRTILAVGRSDRPFDFKRSSEDRPHPGEAEQPPPDCPFCEGREDRTPPEVWADRPGDGGPDTPGWRARSVPNLYPALAGEPGATGGDTPKGADPPRASARRGGPDPFPSG